MSEMVTLETDLRGFNAALVQYAQRKRWTMFQVLQVKGTDLAFAISRSLANATPGKGVVTAERLAGLRSRSEGVALRPGLKDRMAAKYQASTRVSDRKVEIGRGKRRAGSVVSKGKRLNLQALAVRAELALRERGRGYRPFSARLSLKQFASGGLGGIAEKFGRYHQILARYGIHQAGDETTAEFRWGGDGQSKIAEALSNPSGMMAISAGIREATTDINIYLQRKLAEDFKKVGL